MTPVALAWVAGLFEGEGSVRVNKATRRNLGHLVVSVTNCDRDLLAPFLAWGGQIKPVSTRAECRPAWQWTIAARLAAAFLTDIVPYLVSGRQRERALLGLEFQEQKRYGRVDDSYRSEQFAFYLAMREINHRGAA